MTQIPLGKLYAVGIGTGDSELLTLKAARLIKECDVVAIPEKNKGQADSFAWKIISGAISDHEMQGEKLFIHFPMTRNAKINQIAWTSGAQAIQKKLQAGLSVVFVTEGDPSVYSTWGYMQTKLQQTLPTLNIEIIPGVTSITAIPAVTQIPLADGQERFCVVPATYGIECLDELVKEFDTIMLIKAGRNVDALIAKLTELNLLECATYVSHATTDKQEIYRNLHDVPKEQRYFAMVQISIRSRKGILAQTDAHKSHKDKL